MSENMNKGAIFKNDNKKEDKHPDYKGKINWGGTDIEISMWIAESKQGKKYFSVRLAEPFVAKTTTFEENNDLPF